MKINCEIREDDSPDFPSLWKWGKDSRDVIFLFNETCGVWVRGQFLGEFTSNFVGELEKEFIRMKGSVTFEL